MKANIYSLLPALRCYFVFLDVRCDASATPLATSCRSSICARASFRDAHHHHLHQTHFYRYCRRFCAQVGCALAVRVMEAMHCHTPGQDAYSGPLTIFRPKKGMPVQISCTASRSTIRTDVWECGSVRNKENLFQDVRFEVCV
jgi:hypothetical protein